MKGKTIVYSTNTDSDDVSVVDTQKREEIARIPVGGSPRGAVKFDKIQKFGYVSNCAGNTISVIDLYTNRELTKITVGLAPRGLAISEDSKHAFVSNSGSNTLSVIDLVKRTSITEIAMGKNPRHMAILPKRDIVLVCEWGSDCVSILDYSDGINTISMSNTIYVGPNARPYSLNVNSTGNKAYVANTQADYMSILNIEEAKEENRVNVGYGGRAIVLSPDEKYAFISVENTNEIATVNLSSNQVVNKVKVGPCPRGIALDKINNILYIAPFPRSTSIATDSRNSLSVLDASNPEETKDIGDIKVGLGPCSVSVLNR